MLQQNSSPANFIGQVFAHKLNFISTTLSNRGIDLSHLLKGTDIEPDRLNDLEYKINKEQIVSFYRNILTLKIPEVSLLLGASIKLKDYGLYGCTLLCSKDLRSLLEFSLRYHNLVTKTVNMSLHVESKSNQSCIRF